MEDKYLKIHDGRIPVGEILRLQSAGSPMAQKLNGQQIHIVSKLLILVLKLMEATEEEERKERKRKKERKGRKEEKDRKEKNKKPTKNGKKPSFL